MIRILLVDDQNIVRQGIQALLEPKPKLKIVGTAEDGNSAMEQIKTLRPDIVLMDIEMPGMSGITVTHKICQQFPKTKVLILSSQKNQEYVIQALQAGAGAYLLKNTLADDLEQAIYLVYRGHSQLESQLLKKVLVEASLSPSIKSVEQSESITVSKKSVQKISLKLHSEENIVSDSNSNDKFLQTTRENNKNKLLAQNHKFKWLWLSLSLAIIGGVYLSWLWLKQNKAYVPIENQSSAAISVRVQTLEANNFQNTSEFNGVLEAKQRVSLRPETEERIVEIFVNSGTIVSEGTPLIRLRPDKNRAQLNSAIAITNSLEAKLKQTESEFNASEAEQSSALAELKLQEEEFKRTSFLVIEGAQSAQELDRVKRDRQAALATFEAAKKKVKAAESAVNEAAANLQQAEAEADLEQENLRDTVIVAPVAGMIGDIPLKIGDYVKTTDVLTTITQNQTLELRLAVPIEYASKLHIGLPVEIRTSQGDDPLVIGKINFISPRVDTTSQTVLTKASFPNPQGKLRDKQFVGAKIIWEQVSGVLVPASAITRLGNQAFVFVAKNSAATESGKPQPIAEQRPITLGSIQGNYYQVIDGLETGETLITSGWLNLSDGTAIMPEPTNFPK